MDTFARALKTAKELTLQEDLLRIVAIRLAVITLNYLKWLSSPLFWILSLRTPQKVPPIEDPILQMSATTLARMIRKKEVKSEVLVRKYIARIKKVNGVLNAVVDERFSSAVKDARTVDKFLFHTKMGEEDIARAKPLLGLPITVKEACKVKGLSFAVGCKTRLGFIAKEDGEAVARLKKAGAIILLVSNTPEACMSLECQNLITGSTRNPYNTNHSSGGSSGGEGALVGAGASLIGLGSDLAGSIRIPCMFNGIFGHKPTSGASPIGGHYPTCDDKTYYASQSIGPLVRYAEDLKLVMKTLLVNDAVDLDEKVDVAKLTVFYMTDLGNVVLRSPIEKDIKVALLKCVDYLESRGSKVSDVKFNDLGWSFDMTSAIYLNFDDKPDLLLDQNNPPQRFDLCREVVKMLFSRSTIGSVTVFHEVANWAHMVVSKPSRQYEKLAEGLKAEFREHLGKDGVFLYPTFPTSAFQHKQFLLTGMGVAYTMAFNILGFPSTQVPLGLNKKALPIGIQVVANPGRDVLCLAVAEELEKAFGGWLPPYKLI